MASKEDPRVTRIAKICLAFPEVARETCGGHAGFSVRKKTFAWYLDNHHGDSIVAISCKALPGDNTALVAAHPDRYCLPAYMARWGWVSLRLDVGKVDWEEVAELLRGSYLQVAPKRLAAQVGMG